MFHTVQPGETLWSLSRKHGLSVEEIVEVNGLKSADQLAAGQVLFLPAARGAREAQANPVDEARESEERLPPAPALSAGGGARLAWPVDGVVLREFRKGKRQTTPYDGILIAAPAGTAVTAAADGEVLFAGDQGTGYGVIVVVRHGPRPEGLVTVYGHLGQVRVRKGDRVRAGQVLASVGRSGGVESPRLHFQVRQGRTVLDPSSFLPP